MNILSISLLAVLLLTLAGCGESEKASGSNTKAAVSTGAEKQLAPKFAEVKLMAEQGIAPAQRLLGLMYALGQDAPQDYKEAMKWYRLAADQGDAESQYHLGALYEKGRGVPQDYKEAVKWFRLAAEQGYASAQQSLGAKYALGQGVPQDNKEAVKWLQLAADKGDAQAQYNLGFMYYSGQGVPQDDKEAVKWYQLAAEQGDSNAQYNLGLMYGQGRGIPQNYMQAHILTNIAAANTNDSEKQNKYIKSRDSAAAFMTAQQIAEANEIARRCISSKFKGCSNWSEPPKTSEPLPQTKTTVITDSKRHDLDASVNTSTARQRRQKYSDLRDCLNLQSNEAIAKCAGE